ncbi:hypothetical protein AVEN_110882-1 [Araneus ventricosus]|uniref:Uncharacterized protein n=1 Tax=Araneus ventricosus TaxID=182803 RepID=A0A4Y2V5C1_ARAVE|nr:hypothetical protein AVEN_110882-1 [Araneus ventricosus]
MFAEVLSLQFNYRTAQPIVIKVMSRYGKMNLRYTVRPSIEPPSGVMRKFRGGVGWMPTQVSSSYNGLELQNSPHVAAHNSLVHERIFKDLESNFEIFLQERKIQPEQGAFSHSAKARHLR